MEHCSSHAGQALLGDEIHGVNFDEQWVHLDPDADYDQAVAGLRGVIDSYPGLYRTMQTYLRERVKEVLSGVKRGDRRARVRSGHQRPLEEGRGDCRQDGRGSTGSSTSASSRSSRFRKSRSRSTSTRPAATGSRPGTSAASLRSSRERGGRRHLRGRQGLRRTRLEHPLRPRQRDGRREPADRHAERRAGAAPPRSRRPDQADREHDQARGAVAPGRRGRRRGRPRPRLDRRRRQGAA